MLREQMVYVCTCSKCSHKWITKVKEIPVRCAKCNRVTWNDDYDFSLPQNAVVNPLPVDDTSSPFEPLQAEIKQKLSLDQLKALIAPIESGVVTQAAPVPVVEDWRFTKDNPQYDDNGRVYRQQYLAPLGKRRRSVEVDADDLEMIIER